MTEPNLTGDGRTVVLDTSLFETRLVERIVSAQEDLDKALTAQADQSHIRTRRFPQRGGGRLPWLRPPRRQSGRDDSGDGVRYDVLRLPEPGLARKAERDRADYLRWRDAGVLRLTEGRRRPASLTKRRDQD